MACGVARQATGLRSCLHPVLLGQIGYPKFRYRWAASVESLQAARPFASDNGPAVFY
jgi:hypothetical protein